MSELKPLDTQIAGHTEEHGGSESIPRFLVSEDGFVYKPIPTTRGQQELDFYVNTPHYPPALLKYVPKFSKTTVVNHIKYLGIENCTYGFKSDKICVSDIKIGTRTYGDDAKPEKIKQEQDKSSKTTTVSLGIRFCGAKVVNFETGQSEKLDKDWGKKLKKENIYNEGIKKFFSTQNQHVNAIVNAFLKDLKEIQGYFQTNKEYAFYSSSLLFVYGELDETIKNPSITLIPNSNFGIILKMIDFAHVSPLKGERIDESYLTGINNLIDFFNLFIKELN